MEGSSHFNVPKVETDAINFLPHTKLPEALMRYETSAEDLRRHMTPEMRLLLRLTDQTALRSAALPESQ